MLAQLRGSSTQTSCSRAEAWQSDSPPDQVLPDHTGWPWALVSQRRNPDAAFLASCAFMRNALCMLKHSPNQDLCRLAGKLPTRLSQWLVNSH